MENKRKIWGKKLSGKNAFRIIIGAMTTWLLLIAVEAEESTPADIVLDLVVFAALLLVSYVFASVIGEEIVVRRQTSFRRIFEITLEVSPVILPTLPPFLIFVVASFNTFSVQTGFYLSDFSLLVTLFLMGFFAGKAIGEIRRGVLDGILAAAIGVALVILRGIVL